MNTLIMLRNMTFTQFKIFAININRKDLSVNVLAWINYLCSYIYIDIS